MSKKLKTLILTVSVLGLTVMFGCSAFQDLITPCYIPEGNIEYADTEATLFLPYTTLFDAKRVDSKMAFVYSMKQISDKMEYNFRKGIGNVHMLAAEEFQTKMFSPEGPIGLILPTLLGTGIGALLIKRPGDKSKKELEANG